MIKSVSITNHLGETIDLVIGGLGDSGLLIRDITGLGPPKANINSTAMTTTDGGVFNSARVNERNIVFNIKTQHPVEANRQKLYKFFPIKKKIKLVFELDYRTCETTGYVESNEPTIFTNDSGSVISIICPDPYLYSLEDNVTLFSGITSEFEFPFWNDSTTEPLISAGSIQTDQIQTVLYEGDADTGCMIYIHSTGDVENLTISNSGTNEALSIDTDKLFAMTGHHIIANDDIIISTVKGNKFILLLRNGEYINILNCLVKGSKWFQLTNGDNMFAFTAETGSTNLQFRVENKVLYEGV